jgi:hypothetical protein
MDSNISDTYDSKITNSYGMSTLVKVGSYTVRVSLYRFWNLII